MRKQHISEVIGHIDQKYVTEANTTRPRSRRNNWMKWGAAAACLALAVIAAVLLIPGRNDGPPSAGGVRVYKSLTIQESSYPDWPWEWKMVYEQYPEVTFQGRRYTTRSRAIREALLGPAIGTCEAVGTDYQTGNTYTASFEARQITGISRERLIALEMDGAFYVYLRSGDQPPATLGQLMDEFDLTNTLKLSCFSRCQGYDSEGYYSLSDGTALWQIISRCREATLVEDRSGWNVSGRRHLSFTATAEALGCYKKALYVTEDGYLWTNLRNRSLLYHIGTDAAAEIIHYATQNAAEATFEPYEYTLTGTLTEIGDGYILLDDSILCVNEQDGLVFRILTGDRRAQRCIDYGGLQVGDVIVVKFSEPINPTTDTPISGAHAICKGQIIDGDVAIPE